MEGIVLCGATGEYPALTPEEFKEVLSAGTVRPSGKLLVGIAARTLQETIQRGQTASVAGASAVLLAPPHFFRYSQDDLASYVRSVATEVPLPVLLYNLPQFTNGFETATVQTVFSECPNVVGIKDSSGSLDLLRTLKHGEHAAACRILGNDGVLIEALQAGLCDGLISGVAGVLPELIRYVWSCDAARRENRVLLDEIIEQLNRFPTPWGLKWIAEFRGFGNAEFLQSQSEARAQQGGEFCAWLAEWLPRTTSRLASLQVSA
jgi:4-hydroxy-tetrahydrodipicolinate synthase